MENNFYIKILEDAIITYNKSILMWQKATWCDYSDKIIKAQLKIHGFKQTISEIKQLCR